MPARNSQSQTRSTTGGAPGQRTGERQPRLAIIAGSSWLGAELASRLDAAGYSVIVIDADAEALARIKGSFGGIVLQEDPSDPAVLERCRIREASLLMALFADDATNLLIGKMAETIYAVPDVRILLLDSGHRAVMAGSAIKVISPPEMLSTATMADLEEMEAIR